MDFQDITGAGAASPFTGTRLGDTKGSSGNMLTTAANNNFPLPQDTAIFDANSFSANSQTVTITGAFRLPTLDFSAITKTGIKLENINNSVTVFGDVTLKASMVVSGTTGTYTYSGRNTQTITSAGVSWTQPHTVNSPGGTVRLGDAFTTASSRTLTLTSGEFNLNGQDMSVGVLSLSNSNTRTLTLGSGTLTLTGTATVFDAATATGLTVTATSGTIKINDSSASAKAFSGRGKTYNNIWLTGAGRVSPA